MIGQSMTGYPTILGNLKALGSKVPIEMSNEPPSKKTKLELNSESILKNPIHAALEDFDPPFPEDDQRTNDECEDNTDREYSPDPDPEGNLELAPGTEVNTRLNTGYTSAYGQHIARSILSSPRYRHLHLRNLRIIALRGQGPTIQ